MDIIIHILKTQIIKIINKIGFYSMILLLIMQDHNKLKIKHLGDNKI